MLSASVVRAPRRHLRTSLALVVVALAACGGSDEPVTPTPTPTIALAVAPGTLTFAQGQSGSATVTLTRGGGYAGAVALSASGAPAGLNVTFNPSSLTGTSTTSAVLVSAAATTAPGTYTLSLRGTGPGVTEAVGSLAVTVTAAAQPTLGIVSAVPATLSVAAGQSGTTTITLARGGGFTGTADLTVEGLPANVTGTFAPAAVGPTATTSTLTIAAGANAAAGAAQITVRARGQGVADATLPLALTITPPVVVGGFTVAVAPTTLSVAQGASGSARFSIARTGGFTGPVALTTSGAPAGVTVTAPASVTGDTANVAVTVASNVAAGTYPITLTGTAEGRPTQTATLTLTVTAAPTGSFSLGVSPGTLSLQQGTNGTATINVARTAPFAGAVTLAASSATAGITAEVSPASATGATSQVTVRANSTVPVGSYTVTVTGTAAGLATQTATLNVSVTAAATGGSNRVTYNFCAPDLPIWVAAQSENGAWTRVTAGANNSYAFNVGARGGIAYVTQSGSAYDLTVVYASAAELVSASNAPCATLAERGTKRLTGTLAGVAPTDAAVITLGPATQFALGIQPAFTLDSVPDGPLNLVASRATLSEDGDIIPTRIILRRGVNYANGSAIPTLDFNGSEAFAPAAGNLTIGNLLTDTAFVASSFYTGSFGAGAFSFRQAAGSAPARYNGLPTDRLQAGDLQTLLVLAQQRGVETSARGAVQFFRTVNDRTLSLGGYLSQPAITANAQTPYLRLRAAFGGQADYNRGAQVDFTQRDRSASVAMTAAYLGGLPTTWELTIPDLSAAGFDPTWALRTGTPTEWSTMAFGGQIFLLLGDTPTDGTTFQFAQRNGTFGGSAIRRSVAPLGRTGSAAARAGAAATRLDRMQGSLRRLR